MDSVEKLLSELEPDKLTELDALLEGDDRPWYPTPGPQFDAVHSEADWLLYGGAGGAGKTDLLLGLAFTQHKRTLLVRRQYSDMGGLIDRSKELNGGDQGFSGKPPPRLRTGDDRIIDFGGLKDPGDEQTWQGVAHDFIGFDETVQLREWQVRYLLGWLRSGDPGQRCRCVMATNPPVMSQGDWIIPMFAPWLDPHFEDRAKPGELRWCVTVDDEGGQSVDRWVEGPDVKIESGRFKEDGSPIYLKPMSRTFIPGRLDDNPFLRDTNYRAGLDALQEPLRSAIRDGNFFAAKQDRDDQLIPSEWIHAAQNRWLDAGGKPAPGIPMCAIGVDSARRHDETVLAPRYDGFYPELVKLPGKETPTGRDVAALILKHRRDGAVPVIDCGEMSGAEAFAHLEENGVQCVRYVGMDGSVARSRTKHLKFFNKRAESYWKFMEALDPNQDGGSPIALPNDQKLFNDLTAVSWELTPNGVKITPKKDVVEQLGRSPDAGDAVVMSWAAGDRSVVAMGMYRADQRSMGGKNRPQVNMGPRKRPH